MPSGFGVKPDKNATDDKEFLNSQFLEQQIGATLESLNKLSAIQEQQAQFNQRIVETLDNLKAKPQEKEEIKPPEDFDITQVGDPNSESGKYFEYLLSQRDKALEQEILNRVDEKVKATNFEKEIEKGFDLVKEKYNVDDDKLKEFRAWTEKPEGTNLDVLYKVFETVNNKEEVAPPEEPGRLSGVSGEEQPTFSESFVESLKPEI